MNPTPPPPSICNTKCIDPSLIITNTLTSSGNPQVGHFVYTLDYNLNIACGILENINPDGFLITSHNFTWRSNNCFTTIEPANIYRIELLCEQSVQLVQKLEVELEERRKELNELRALLQKGDI